MKTEQPVNQLRSDFITVCHLAGSIVIVLPPRCYFIFTCNTESIVHLEDLRTFSSMLTNSSKSR